MTPTEPKRLPPLFRFFHFGQGYTQGFFAYRELMERRKMYLSNPKYFNDPYDPLPSFTKFTEEYFSQQTLKDFALNGIFESATKRPPLPFHLLKEVSLGAWGKTETEWLEHYRNVVAEHMRILCLCARVTGNLMWSHYSSSHSGFAVEIDPVAAPWSEMESAGVVHQVKYGPKRPQAALDGISSSDDFLHKSPEWKYEEEWRVTVTPKSSGLNEDQFGTYVQLGEESIAALYLGWRVKLTAEIQQGLTIFRKNFPAATLHQMKPDKDGYDLIVAPFEIDRMLPDISKGG